MQHNPVFIFWWFFFHGGLTLSFTNLETTRDPLMNFWFYILHSLHLTYISHCYSIQYYWNMSYTFVFLCHKAPVSSTAQGECHLRHKMPLSVLLKLGVASPDSPCHASDTSYLASWYDSEIEDKQLEFSLESIFSTLFLYDFNLSVHLYGPGYDQCSMSI